MGGIGLERIDVDDLGQKVRDRYGLPIGRLAVAPGGSEALGLVADGRHFVRAEPHAELEAPLAVPVALRQEGGVTAAVAPYRTRTGRLTFIHGPYTVAVFPYIAGRPAAEPDAAEAAGVVARVHQRRLFLPALRRITLGHQLSQSVRRVLRAPGRRDTVHADEARRLIHAERASIETALAVMRRLNTVARTLPLRWAVTHGAPALRNFLVDGSGRLHLIDWGTAALGPVERDLWHLSGPGFPAAVRRYAEETGWGRELRSEVFALYEYRAWLRGIVRPAEALLYGRGDPGSDAEAWAALRQCLPLPSGELDRRCRAMADAVAGL